MFKRRKRPTQLVERSKNQRGRAERSRNNRNISSLGRGKFLPRESPIFHRISSRSFARIQHSRAFSKGRSRATDEERGEKERERERERKTGVSWATCKDNLTIRAKGRCCTRRCEKRFHESLARFKPWSPVFQPTAFQPAATRNIAGNLAPQNELLKPSPILGDRCHVVSSHENGARNRERVNRLFTDRVSLSRSNNSIGPTYGRKITPKVDGQRGRSARSAV